MPPLDSAAVVAAVRDYVARAVAPLQAEIKQAYAEAAAIKLMVQEVAKIPIPKDGTDGKDGSPGEPGKDGASVGVEDLRPLVVEEISNTIALVPKAKDGAPGRDAAQIEVAAAIDEGKSYPRGTYAKHANGLWRAYEATEGLRGWECLVAGIAAVEITSDGEREFAIKAVMSDGTVSAQVFKVPVAIYRGVFVDGRQYEHGDQVSWGAHQWHCNEPTTEKPDTAGKAWTLAVKRGRDGKEGPAGKDGKTIVVKEKA